MSGWLEYVPSHNNVEDDVMSNSDSESHSSHDTDEDSAPEVWDETDSESESGGNSDHRHEAKTQLHRRSQTFRIGWARVNHRLRREAR